MKRTFIALNLLAWLVLPVLAEPAHKPQGAHVDLEAAARATAALYANWPVYPPAPQQPVAPKQMPAQPALPVVAPAEVRSPVMPVVSVPAHAAPLSPTIAAPVTSVLPAAAEVWEGAYQCEFREKVLLRPDAVAEQVELQWKGQRWKMRRISSRSGALRLEDASARMVWIQLANKSMLLDQRAGRRLLDECQHDVQVQTAAQMKTNPPPALFDTTGMGR